MSANNMIHNIIHYFLCYIFFEPAGEAHQIDIQSKVKKGVKVY